MRHTTRFVAALLLGVLFLPHAETVAQEQEGTLDKIARTGEFVIGYRTDSVPLSFERSPGQAEGYSVELCRRIAKSVQEHFGEKKIDVRFVSVTSDDRISSIAEGKADIECGSTTITLSRQERVDFSLPTFVTGGSIVSLATSGIASMADLSGKRVGVAKDTTTVDQLKNYLEENAIDAEIVIVGDRTEGWARLNQDNIDALASDQIVLIGLIMSAPDPQRYTLDSEIFSYEPYGFVLRRDDADFRLLVNRVLAGIYRSGDHADIFYKWIVRTGISVPPTLAAMYQLAALPE